MYAASSTGVPAAVQLSTEKPQAQIKVAATVKTADCHCLAVFQKTFSDFIHML